MKKVIIVILAALAFSVAAVAQPKAIGLRGGWDAGVSYEHYLGGENFLEANAFLYGYNSLWIDAAASYNFMIVRPNWTPKGEWGFYIGPGATAGTYVDSEGNTAFNAGIFAQIGLEYTFWFPLNLSFDIRPGYHFMSNTAMYYPAFSVRYAF